jgi:hypothetical protein
VLIGGQKFRSSRQQPAAQQLASPGEYATVRDRKETNDKNVGEKGIFE